MTIEFWDATGRFPINFKIIQSWCLSVLTEHGIIEAELSIRIVDAEEGYHLNHSYRRKTHATNVLSFPAEFKVPGGPLILGDIAICLPVIEAESKAQHKAFDQHCAHIIVHGILHLLGFNHIDDLEAKKMEAEEIGILEKLGYPNPYLI